MKFQIFKTSTMYEEDPRIKGALKESIPYHYNEIKACSPWRKEGVPARDEMRECWTIEINTLEELLHLAESNKHPVIVSLANSDSIGFRLPSVEIYDNYRE